MSKSLQRRDASGAVGRPLARLLETANREHERANQSAANAIEHAVRAGEALAKARDLCAAGEWSEFVAASFRGSMRTAQKYMRLARNIRTLQAQGPVAALTSQNEAAKALTTIIRGDSRSPQAALRRITAHRPTLHPARAPPTSAYVKRDTRVADNASGGSALNPERPIWDRPSAKH